MNQHFGILYGILCTYSELVVLRRQIFEKKINPVVGTFVETVVHTGRMGSVCHDRILIFPKMKLL